MKFKVYDNRRKKFVEDQTYFLIKSSGELVYGSECGFGPTALDYSLVFYPDNEDVIDCEHKHDGCCP